MDDDVVITAEDQERIEAMVAVYRSQITNLYKMAYLQGAMEQVQKERDALRRVANA